MSRENVEVVRKVYEAVAAGNRQEVLKLYDPEVEIDGSRLPETSLMGETVLRGHDGLRYFTRNWSEAWESFEDHCDELIAVGEYVVALVTRRGRGRASGIESNAERAGIWTVRDGKVARVVWFPTHAEALEAVGLRE